MIYIFIALLVATILVVTFFHYANKHWLENWFGLLLPLSIFLGLGVGAAWLLFAVMSGSWFSAKYKTQILNREYGTAYTTEEIFWASSVIDTIRELDRRRYEVNGDFRRQQADSKSDRDNRSYQEVSP